MASSDETFVQSAADKLGVGFATRGNTLKELAELLFDLLGKRKLVDAAHMKRLLLESHAQYLVDVSTAFTEEEENRLFSILMKHA